MSFTLASMLKNSSNSLLWVIFSVPSRGLMMPGISSPKDKWSIRWEKLYAVMRRGEQVQVESRLQGVTERALSETPSAYSPV